MKVIVLTLGENDHLVETPTEAKIVMRSDGHLWWKKHSYRLLVLATPYCTWDYELSPGHRALEYVALKELTEREKVELAYHRFELPTYRPGMFNPAKKQWEDNRPRRQERARKDADDDARAAAKKRDDEYQQAIIDAMMDD